MEKFRRELGLLMSNRINLDFWEKLSDRKSLPKSFESLSVNENLQLSQAELREWGLKHMYVPKTSKSSVPMDSNSSIQDIRSENGSCDSLASVQSNGNGSNCIATVSHHFHDQDTNENNTGHNINSNGNHNQLLFQRSAETKRSSEESTNSAPKMNQFIDLTMEVEEDKILAKWKSALKKKRLGKRFAKKKINGPTKKQEKTVYCSEVTPEESGWISLSSSDEDD